MKMRIKNKKYRLLRLAIHKSAIAKAKSQSPKK
jgi:hypothetical protein